LTAVLDIILDFLALLVLSILSLARPDAGTQA